MALPDRPDDAGDAVADADELLAALLRRFIGQAALTIVVGVGVLLLVDDPWRRFAFLAVVAKAAIDLAIFRARRRMILYERDFPDDDDTASGGDQTPETKGRG